MASLELPENKRREKRASFVDSFEGAEAAVPLRELMRRHDVKRHADSGEVRSTLSL